MSLDEPVHLDLTDDERYVLDQGLLDWGGPARPTDALAAAMGFRDVADLHRTGNRLREAVRRGDPLPASDWRRALVATEIVFVSDVFGAGLDWRFTAGLSDEDTIGIIRRLQRKISRA